MNSENGTFSHFLDSPVAEDNNDSSEFAVTVEMAFSSYRDSLYKRRDSSEDSIGGGGSAHTNRNHEDLRSAPEIQRRRHGLTILSNAKSVRHMAPFAMHSVKRGSVEWNNMIRPFVSDLASKCCYRLRSASEIFYRPYACHAAVLFVDLCGYSKIAAALSKHGAFVLSSAVNKYFDRILQIVHKFGGDVVKFAGDAVLIVWDGPKKDLNLNVICASKCALTIQEQVGSHLIPGFNLYFRVHCAVTCGILDTEVFEAPTSVNMQRLYHVVGGDPIAEISELVDIAKKGDVCVSGEVVSRLGERAQYCDCDDGVNNADTGENGQGQRDDLSQAENAKILIGLDVDSTLEDAIDAYVENQQVARMQRRDINKEENFIHPSVLNRLLVGGSTPTQVAQMRNLCVLFIAMTCITGSPVNWLTEVQGVLDKFNCPIVQIVDDDKGVHIIAAINLYEAVVDPTSKGLDTCRELVEREVGCAIGMAMGSAFCGVTGSSRFACRWDITGPPAVRAARLMQYALKTGTEVAIDASVYDAERITPRMKILHEHVALKGSPNTIPVYTLSELRDFPACMILESLAFANVHAGAATEIQKHILGDPSKESSQRSVTAVIVTGPVRSGKETVCKRSAGLASILPVLHTCDETLGLLQFARTMATWFKFHDHISSVKSIAESILNHLDRNHWTRAHDECVSLARAALSEGLKVAFILDNVHLLDTYSLSLIRECLVAGSPHNLSRARSVQNFNPDSFPVNSDYAAANTHAPVSTADATIFSPGSGGISNNGWAGYPGKISFMCIHVPLYNQRTAKCVAYEIARAQKISVPIIEVVEASRDDLRLCMEEGGDLLVTDQWLDIFEHNSGNCAGYFTALAASIQRKSSVKWKDGELGLAGLTDGLKLFIPSGAAPDYNHLSVMQVNAGSAMEFAKVYDELPPLFQTLCKVVALGTWKGFYKVPSFILWEVLNDLISDGVEAEQLNIMLSEMKDMYLLKLEKEEDGDLVSFQCPPLGHIALDVCTPAQIQRICKALIERLDDFLFQDFIVTWVVADLHNKSGGNTELRKHLWRKGYEIYLEESKDWEGKDIERSYWKEIIKREVEAAGYDVQDVLGDHFDHTKPVSNDEEKLADFAFAALKNYVVPIAFGPMGNTLFVMIRSTYRGARAFRGASRSEVVKLQNDTKSAFQRYQTEVMLLEKYLNENDCGESSQEAFRSEIEMLESIVQPAKKVDEVKVKVEMMLNRFIPMYVEPRLKRLLNLVCILRGKYRSENKISEMIVRKAPKPILHAYESILREREDGPTTSCDYIKLAQVAIMKLAICNWKPKPLPEFIPVFQYQTVARIRDLVFHRQDTTADDLEAFLVSTALFS